MDNSWTANEERIRIRTPWKETVWYLHWLYITADENSSTFKSRIRTYMSDDSICWNKYNFYSVTLKVLFWVFRHKNNYTEVKKTSLQVANIFYTVMKANDGAGGGEPA